MDWQGFHDLASLSPPSGFRRVSIANDIYTSFKISVVFDDDASRLDVAYETSFFTYRDLLERFAVPLHLTLDNNLASDQVGYRLPIRTDGQPAVARFQRALNLAIQVQIFIRMNVTNDANGFADARARPHRLRRSQIHIRRQWCVGGRWTWRGGWHLRGGLRPLFVPHRSSPL